jgi:hypothetical protein
MQVTAKADGAGFYRFEVAVEGQATRWQFQNPAAQPINITANTIPTFDVPITSTNIADTTTVSFLTITTKCFTTAAATTPRFISFRRIPIIGKS